MVRPGDSVGERGLSHPRIARVDSGSDCTKARRRELAARCDFVPPAERDVIVALDGDELVLRVAHEYLHMGRPIFGMNCRPVGFLLNAYRQLSACCRTGLPIAVQSSKVTSVELASLI